MTSGIYGIVNKQNGYKYVGSSKDLSNRWVEHRGELRGNKHINGNLQYAWLKHGEDSFEFVILEVVNDLSQLYMREQYWIDQGTQYNIALVAGCDLGEHNKSLWQDKTYRRAGLKQLDEARNNPNMVNSCRAASLKMWQNPEYQAKHAKSMSSAETRKKLSESHKGVVWSEERRANHKAAFNNLETREKMRLGRLGRKLSEETKAKMSLSHRLNKERL